MHEIAVASPGACILLILTACGLTEISDRRELNHDGPPSIETALQACQRLCCALLISKFDIHAPNHMIGQVVTDIEVLDFAMLAKLLENVLIEVLLKCNSN